MNRSFLSAASLLFVLLFSASAFAQGRAPHHPAKKRISFKLLKEALTKLEAIEQKLEAKGKLGPKQVDMLRLEVKEARLQVREFLMEMENRKEMLPAYECCPCKGRGEEVREGKLEINVNIQGTGEEVMEPLTAQQYNGLLGALKEQGFADDKLTVLQEASKNGYFTVEQVKGILKMFSFPDDKLTALRSVRDRIVDPENQFLLYGSFVHSSDKDEAKKILEGN
jgi:hypothetical protein